MWSLCNYIVIVLYLYNLQLFSLYICELLRQTVHMCEQLKSTTSFYEKYYSHFLSHLKKTTSFYEKYYSHFKDLHEKYQKPFQKSAIKKCEQRPDQKVSTSCGRYLHFLLALQKTRKEPEVWSEQKGATRILF